MTREEAREVLGDVRAYLASRASLENEMLAGRTFTDICNAIKALEKEPCREADDYENEISDLYNRLDIVEYDKERLREEVTTLEEKLKGLSAEPCGDAISRQAVLDGLGSIAKVKAKSDAQKALMGRVMFFTEQLPPVTPQPKTGHWINVSDGYGDNAYICECSECKDTVWVYKDADRKWNFCPNCGAKMTESEG